METENIHQTIKFNAPAKQIYDALMQSDKHSEFTRSKAVIKNRVGGTFSVWDGYATGQFETLQPEKLIVQTWRASDWPNGVTSKVMYKLEGKDKKTVLEFTQIGIPKKFTKDIALGWKQYYWKPLKDYLKNEFSKNN